VRTARARPAWASPAWAPSRAIGAAAGYGLVVLLLVGGEAAGAAGSLGSVVIPNFGPGYAVTSQGPGNPSQFASNAPDPAATKGALSTLAGSSSTYARVWQADGGLNEVQDLLVQFPSAVGARVFLQAAQHSLESGEIVSSDALASIPGARRVTYFGAAGDGVGQAITMRAGTYVDLLSFFSAASGNARPISPTDAERVALTQHAAMVGATGGAAPHRAAPAAKKGDSAGAIGLAVLAVAVLALALVTPLVLQRRHRRALREAPGETAVVSATASDGDARDDLRQGSG
jgi:hypothetical protein